MAEIWKPLNVSDYIYWVECILNESSDELNEWEELFIESIYKRLQANNNLTKNQADKLESIYAEKTK